MIRRSPLSVRGQAMRTVLMTFLAFGACVQHTNLVPTHVLISQRISRPTGDVFGVCEVYLNEPWADFLRKCGPPLESLPWKDVPDGTCHFYKTNTVALRSEIHATAPVVAVCTALDPEPARPGEVERRSAETPAVKLVVGLREVPARAGPTPLVPGI